MNKKHRKRAREAEKFEQATDEFVRLCREKFGEDLTLVVLFGSVARGTAEKYSDIDLLMVMNNLPKRILDRESVVSEEIHQIVMKYHIRVMPILSKPEDFSSRMINPLVYGILTGYKVLYDPSGFWANYLQQIKPRILEMQPEYIEGGVNGRRWKVANLI